MRQGFTLPANTILSNVLAESVDGTVVVGQTLDLDPALPFPNSGHSCCACRLPRMDDDLTALRPSLVSVSSNASRRDG
jgi:hypothetical protein